MSEHEKYHIVFEWWNILLINKSNKNQISVDEFNLKPIKSIAPNYMMEPSVTIK
jgi:hypothetical protein